MLQNHGNQCLGLHVRDHLDHGLPAAFYHAGDDGFASGSPAPLPWPLAPDVGLVNLNLAEEGDTVLGHELADLLEHPPGRLVGDADLPFKLLGRYARPGGSHEEHGMEPRLEGSRGLVEDGVRRGRYLSPTEFATVDLAARDAVVFGDFLALGAGHTVGQRAALRKSRQTSSLGNWASNCLIVYFSMNL